MNRKPQTINLKLFAHIPSWLKNKYFIATAVFAAMLLFFDKNDLFTQRNRSNELRALEKSKAYYQGENTSLKKQLDELKNDPATLEKYAREKYMMKKDNEDLFLVPEKD